MIPETTLALTGTHHEQLRSHLFPADGLETAAILVCTRTPGPRLRFLVRDVIFVPYSACSYRTREAITWPGEYVEKARKLTTVVFDKTGTLTKGEPSVTDIKTYNSFIELSVLDCAASAEKGSEHPLAEAIFMKAESDKARINRADNFEVLTGRGVQYSVGNRKVLLGNRTLMQ